jgi:hypothetical protein
MRFWRNKRFLKFDMKYDSINFRVTGYEFGKGKKSVCIVGTMRGNEVQ